MRGFSSVLFIALLASVVGGGCNKQSDDKKFGEPMAPPAGMKAEKGSDKPQAPMPPKPPPPPPAKK